MATGCITRVHSSADRLVEGRGRKQVSPNLYSIAVPAGQVGTAGHVSRPWSVRVVARHAIARAKQSGRAPVRPDR